MQTTTSGSGDLDRCISTVAALTELNCDDATKLEEWYDTKRMSSQPARPCEVVELWCQWLSFY
jgi:hypothetical protein